MKSLLVFLIVVWLHTIAIAQNGKEVYQYLNKAEVAVSTPDSAVYYRTFEMIQGSYLVVDYYIANDSIYMMSVCDEISPELVKNGECVWRYSNGLIKEQGYFKNDERDGIFKTYYDNGMPHSEIFYETGNKKYRQVWTRSGEPLLKNGTGIDTTTLERDFKDLFVEVIEDSLRVAAYKVRFDKGDTIFSVSKNPAEYVGGANLFYESVANALKGKYPKEARKKGVQGNVFVMFIIDKDGSMTEQTIFKGLGSGCDEAALAAVSSTNEWKPAMFEGKPVKSMLILAIRFRL